MYGKAEMHGSVHKPTWADLSLEQDQQSDGLNVTKCFGIKRRRRRSRRGSGTDDLAHGGTKCLPSLDDAPGMMLQLPRLV